MFRRNSKIFSQLERIIVRAFPGTSGPRQTLGNFFKDGGQEIVRARSLEGCSLAPVARSRLRPSDAGLGAMGRSATDARVGPGRSLTGGPCCFARFPAAAVGRHLRIRADRVVQGSRHARCSWPGPGHAALKAPCRLPPPGRLSPTCPAGDPSELLPLPPDRVRCPNRRWHRVDLMNPSGSHRFTAAPRGPII